MSWVVDELGTELKLLTVTHVKVLSGYRKRETVKTTECCGHDISLKAQNHNQYVRRKNRNANHSDTKGKKVKAAVRGRIRHGSLMAYCTLDP
jgi:hypothetical protein